VFLVGYGSHSCSLLRKLSLLSACRFGRCMPVSLVCQRAEVYLLSICGEINSMVRNAL
jgi:hypothetical protein